MPAVLFVCLGNICRSPTAEAVFRHKAAAAGLDARCDSAGTGDWHKGEPPYMPSIFSAQKRGYDLTPLRARVIEPADFLTFDHILGMDKSNLRDLRALRPDGGTEPQLLLHYAPKYGSDIADPWYSREFDKTLEMIEAAVDGLIAHLQTRQPPQ